MKWRTSSSCMLNKEGRMMLLPEREISAGFKVGFVVHLTILIYLYYFITCLKFKDIGGR